MLAAITPESAAGLLRRAHQCLAIAQSKRYTGLGSFQGRQTTQAGAEQDAMDYCEQNLKPAGDSCQITVSACPK